MKTKRALLKGARQLEFEEIDLDDSPLANTAVLARTDFSAVSNGTESAAYVGEPPLRPGPVYPRKVGYCNAATILRVGVAVRGLAAGDRILTHQSHQGAFVCEEGEVLAIISDSVASDIAVLAYLAQLGLTALQTAGFRTGEHVAVIGLGVIGLATAAVAAALGAQVTAIGNAPARLALARRVGAHAAFQLDEPNLHDRVGGPDLIVTTANPWSAWQLALELARFRTRIAVLGFPGRSEGAPNFNPLGSAHFYAQQLAIFAAGIPEETGADGTTLRRNLRAILRLLADGRLPLGDLITHRVAWRELGSIYELAAARDKSLVAAVLNWNPHNE